MNIGKKTIVSGALVVALASGIAIGSSNIFQTNAESITPSATQNRNQQAPQNKQDGQFDPIKGGHIGQNGKKEELLLGDTAEKVRSAALKAVAGATVDRVETDAEGDSYEAHMTKSDGSHVTVKFDTNFNVTKTENGR